MSTQRKVFISYRRADNPDFADRIRDKFIALHGRENVFMDINSLPRGVRVVDRIRQAIQQSNVVIAIVGPKWVELFKDKAANYEDDFVKMELELALKLRKPIIPICISGASVPQGNSLPPKLRRLLEYNFSFLNRNNFHDEMERIIADLEVLVEATNVPKAQEYYESGDRKWRGKDYDGAIADCTSAILLNPNFAKAYSGRGTARAAKGDLDGAIADYNEALRLNPQDANAFYGRGNAHKARGDLESAIADYTYAIRFNPLDASAYINRGNARKDKDDLTGAIADYDEAIRLNPQYAAAYNNRGYVRSAKGDIKGAIADYEKFLNLGGGMEYGNQAQVEQRIRELQKRLDSQP